MTEVMAELLADYKRREQTCRDALAKVPTDDDETNVRAHVRLRAKSQTYGHCAVMLKEALERASATS